jgi:hypothetical protein
MRRRLVISAFAFLVPAAAFAQSDPTPSEPVPTVAEPTVTPAVVATPATPIAPVAEAKEPDATVSDADIAALGLDPARPDDHLNIYGFADFSWRMLLIPSTSLGANYFPKESSFVVGNINLYVTKSLSTRWRSMLEVRFLYAPAGTKNTDGTFTHTAAPNPGDVERPMQWGGVSIERVYLEYDVNEWLKIQAGSFLTPYGIWNVDHGSPTIIPVTRPYIIGENLFPGQQTGLHLYGKHPFGEYQVGYHATLTNGRGPFQAFRDLDNNKAVGGRLELETPWLDGVQLGISAYKGRYTDRPADVVAVDASGTLINTTPLGISYDEVAWGADALLHLGGLHVQTEVIVNDRNYREGAREATRGGFFNDGRYFGAYVLAGYRLDRWWQVMPYAVVELDRLRSGPDLGHEPSILKEIVGLNFRPDPSVVLKVEYDVAQVYSPILDMKFRAFMAQAAWAF